MSASFPAYNPPKQSKVPRNSRNSQLTTPKRSGRVSHRNTPYSTTTSRALQRAKAAQKATPSQEEDQLIGETSYEEPPQSQRKSPFSMHGAKDSNDQEYEEEKTDEDQSGDAFEEQDFKITPSRNIFSRTNTPIKTPVKSPKGQQSTPATGKKTWGQWLGAILPDSVKKPVKAILGAPEEGTTQTKDLIVGTPKKDVMEEDFPESYSVPGSFGKPDDGRRTPPLLLDYEHGASSNHYSSEFDISKSFSGAPSHVSPSGLFVYDKPTPAVKSTAPSKRARRSTMSTPIKSSKALPAVSSLHKPNNFIERMRSAKKTHRYDPYARRTSQKKEKIQLTVEEEKELTPAEKLELLKQRQKERKIAALEDKYEMREALRAMGQVPDDDEQMTDSDSERRPKDKGKGLEGSPSVSTSINQATVEDIAEETPEDTSITKLPIAPSSPPKSPIKKARESPQSMPSRNLFEASAPAPSFLLAGDADTGPGFTISDAPPPAEIPPISLTTPSTWSFGSDSSDKENISAGPPPPPTMSHAQLPAPLTSSVQPPAVSLFGSQPTGGFGLGAPKESTAVGRQRSQAEKFKPMVSSSLRESRTAADYDDKENQSEKEDKENSGEGSKKGGETELKKKGLMLQQAQGSNVFAQKGLKENAGVINVGKSDVKVDVRAKIEAVSLPYFPIHTRTLKNSLLTHPIAVIQAAGFFHNLAV